MRLSLISVFAMVFTACGGSDICDHAAAVGKDTATRVAPCLPAGTTQASATTDLATCKAHESSCSASDKTTLNNFVDCLDNVATPNCKSGAAAGSSQDTANQEAFQVYNNATTACLDSSNFTSISAACQAAYTGSSSGN